MSLASKFHQQERIHEASDKGLHPGPLIRDKLKAAGFSIPAAAVGISVNRANLNNMLLGKTALTPDMAYRLNVLIYPDDEDFEFSRLVLVKQCEHEWAKTSGVRNLAKILVNAGRRYAEKVEMGETANLTLTKAGLQQKYEDEAALGEGNSPLGK